MNRSKQAPTRAELLWANRVMRRMIERSLRLVEQEATQQLRFASDIRRRLGL